MLARLTDTHGFRFVLAASLAAACMLTILARFGGTDCFTASSTALLLLLTIGFSLALVWTFYEPLAGAAAAAGISAPAALCGALAMYALIGVAGWALIGIDGAAISIWPLAILTEADVFGSCE